MAFVAAKCTQCGAEIEVDNARETGFCQYCGTKYVTEKVINNHYTVNVNNFEGANVTIANTVDLKKCYESARRFIRDCNWGEAHRYYAMILEEDPSSWEAYFYCNYIQNIMCSKEEINSSAMALVICLDTVLEMIEKSSSDRSQQAQALVEVADRYYAAADDLHTRILTFEGEDVPLTMMNNHFKSIARVCLNIAVMGYMVGDKIEQRFPWIGDKNPEILVNAWKQGAEFHQDCLKYLPNEAEGRALISSYAAKVQKYTPGYTVQSLDGGSGGGCYVATAVYGSYDCPQVWTLRRFRDFDLAETRRGRAFIKAYYAISPTLVEWFGESSWFKTLSRSALDRLVAECKEKGFSDAPYADKRW